MAFCRKKKRISNSCYQSFKSRNEIPDHPGVLVGIANAHNRREGHELEPYLMIGNVEKCKAIVEKKDSKPMIQFTKQRTR